MEDKVSQNTEQASNLSQDSFCLCLWAYGWGFFPPMDTDFNRIRYFHTYICAAIQPEICNERSLVYMRHKYMHYFAPQRKKILLGHYNILIVLCHLGSFVRLQNAIISKL